MSGRIALGAVLVGAGCLWLLSAADVVSLSYGAWIGVLLVTLGVATALARSGRRLLIALGILVAIAGIPALFVDDDVFSGGIGERDERPRTSADVDTFRHGIGRLTVDLTASRLDLDNELVVASVGIGELVVRVPDDADVDLEAHVGVGNIEAFGESENGVDVSFDRISGTSGARELDLELEVGVGSVRVIGPSRGPG
jgi:hypothetical protein